MNISAKVIEDSISESGTRLTTMQLCYPRFVHAEFMTHRVFSRNASSSRAIPVAKMIEQVRTNPAMPVHWGANQPGMQARAELEGSALHAVMEGWKKAAQEAADTAEWMERYGLHKQVANRILEPFQFIHVIVTATEFGNFFELRDHPDADPNIHALAVRMKLAMGDSTPIYRECNEWHLPYISDIERGAYPIGMLRKMSAARCARVSYLTHDGEYPDPAKDVALYERLVGMVPLHASPVEHQATPDAMLKEAKFGGFDGWEHPELHGNFKGWKQFRKMIEGSAL